MLRLSSPKTLVCMMLIGIVVSSCSSGESTRRYSAVAPAETSPDDEEHPDNRTPTNRRGPTDNASDENPTRDDEEDEIREIYRRKLDARPLIAAVGGWNSCVETPDDSFPNPKGMNLYQPFMQMVRDLTNLFGEEPYVAVSCFRKTLESLSFISSETQGRREMTPDTYFRFLSQLAKELDAPLILVGQSYGGWFVMDYVNHVAGLDDVTMLVTVDPISPRGCDPTEFSEIILSRLTFDFSAPTECGISSSDILSNERVTIAEKVSRWHNLYQFDTFRILHATPIPEASVNTKIDHESIKDAINGHIEMGKYARTWDAIASEIRRAKEP